MTPPYLRPFGETLFTLEQPFQLSTPDLTSGLDPAAEVRRHRRGSDDAAAITPRSGSGGNAAIRRRLNRGF